MRGLAASLAALVAFALCGAAAAPPPSERDFGAPSPAEQAAFDACLKSPRRTCSGRISAACLGQTGSETTAGMVACSERERRLWDARAADVSRKLREKHSPGQAQALDAAAAAFEVWRRAKCSYAASLYEGGSLGRVVAADCMRETAAEWANDLARWLADEDH